MKDAFQTTKVNESNGGDRGPYLRNFQFFEGVPTPVQILRPDAVLFPDGFPELRRHWVEGEMNQFTGKPKFLPPMICTANSESTGKRCLTCYGKQVGAVRADRGQAEPNTELIVPVFDHAKYRKNPQSNKYEPIAPNIQLDPATLRALVTGGLKVLFSTPAQYRKIRTEHDNVQNECADCQAPMLVESLSCEVCRAPVFEAAQLSMMPQDDFRKAKYNPVDCEVCNHHGLLDVNRKCSRCSGRRAKQIYDVVLWASLTKSPGGKDGKEKSDYSFTEARNFPLAQIKPEDLSMFFQLISSTVNQGASIQQQAKALGIQPPKEWLPELNNSPQLARPYAGS